MFNTSKEELQATLQQLDQALSHHEQWHNELTRMLICRLPYDLCDVAEDAHCQCNFGKWCYEKSPNALRNHPAFVALSIEHRLMHQFGARLLLSSVYQPSSLPKDYDSFKNSTNRLRLGIDTLKRELEDSLHSRD